MLRLSVFALALGLGAAGTAHAGLIGAGRTAQVLYYNGNTASGNTENESTTGGPGPVSLASGVSFLAGSLSGSTVQITDTQIIITNTLSGTPYCSGNFSGTGCTDAISGFALLFTGENITGASVNVAGTDSSMNPVIGTAPPYSFAHNGLQLINANEVLVDLTGAVPAGSQTLTLDIATQTSGGVGTPEPASLALLGVGLLGLAMARRARLSER